MKNKNLKGKKVKACVINTILIVSIFLPLLSMINSEVKANPQGWNDDTRLTDDAHYSGNPTIAIDSNNYVHITWYDDRDGNKEIYYTKLNNNGTTVVDDLRLTNTSGISYFPTIAIDSNNYVHITWYDDRDGNKEVYYKKLNTNGNLLVNDTRITNNSADSLKPSIAIDSNDRIHITWQDFRDENYEIYYKWRDGYLT